MYITLVVGCFKVWKQLLSRASWDNEHGLEVILQIVSGSKAHTSYIYRQMRQLREDYSWSSDSKEYMPSKVRGGGYSV